MTTQPELEDDRWMMPALVSKELGVDYHTVIRWCDDPNIPLLHIRAKSVEWTLRIIHRKRLYEWLCVNYNRKIKKFGEDRMQKVRAWMHKESQI